MALPHSLDSTQLYPTLSWLYLILSTLNTTLHTSTLLYPGYILLHQTIILPYSFPWVWSLATAGLSISSITIPCLHELLVLLKAALSPTIFPTFFPHFSLFCFTPSNGSSEWVSPFNYEVFISHKILTWSSNG